MDIARKNGALRFNYHDDCATVTPILLEYIAATIGRFVRPFVINSRQFSTSKHSDHHHPYSMLQGDYDVCLTFY